MRKIISTMMFLVLAYSLAPSTSQAQSPIVSLRYTLNNSVFSPYVFEEWDDALIPTVTYWVIKTNGAVGGYGNRSSGGLGTYQGCPDFFGSRPAFISDYRLGTTHIGTRYECLLSDDVYVDLTPLNLGVQSGLKSCSGICP